MENKFGMMLHSFFKGDTEIRNLLEKGLTVESEDDIEEFKQLSNEKVLEIYKEISLADLCPLAVIEAFSKTSFKRQIEFAISVGEAFSLEFIIERMEEGNPSSMKELFEKANTVFKDLISEFDYYLFLPPFLTDESLLSHPVISKFSEEHILFYSKEIIEEMKKSIKLSPYLKCFKRARDAKDVTLFELVNSANEFIGVGNKKI